jgi:hypothetical protein
MKRLSAFGMMARGARQIGELASGSSAPARQGARLLDAGPFDWGAHFRAMSDEEVAEECAEAALRSHDRAPMIAAMIGSFGAIGFGLWMDHRVAPRAVWPQSSNGRATPRWLR